MGRRPKSIAGRRFGRLIAIEPIETRNGGCTVWRCRCDCGNECFVPSTVLSSGQTRSCGCLRREVVAKRNAGRDSLVEGTDLGLLTQKLMKSNTSGAKGVSLHKRSGKYMAYITLAGKRHYLGLFGTIEEAARARREAEVELYDPILEAHGRKPTGEG